MLRIKQTGTNRANAKVQSKGSFANLCPGLAALKIKFLPSSPLPSLLVENYRTAGLDWQFYVVNQTEIRCER